VTRGAIGDAARGPRCPGGRSTPPSTRRSARAGGPAPTRIWRVVCAGVSRSRGHGSRPAGSRRSWTSTAERSAVGARTTKRARCSTGLPVRAGSAGRAQVQWHGSRGQVAQGPTSVLNPCRMRILRFLRSSQHRPARRPAGPRRRARPPLRRPRPQRTTRERPGLRQALAACRAGDELVVVKLDRLARSLPDARAIADELTRRHVKLNLGGSVHDPDDPVGRLLFNRAGHGRRVRGRSHPGAYARGE
jgi:hypothetical protein